MAREQVADWLGRQGMVGVMGQAKLCHGALGCVGRNVLVWSRRDETRQAWEGATRCESVTIRRDRFGHDQARCWCVWLGRIRQAWWD